VVRFLSNRGIFELSRPPCPPDLAPADFFLCHKFKTAGAGSEVQNVSDIKTNTTAESKAVLLVASDDCLVQLLQIWKKKSVAVKGKLLRTEIKLVSLLFVTSCRPITGVHSFTSDTKIARSGYSHSHCSSAVCGSKHDTNCTNLVCVMAS
jgi:hypothetical protein